MERRVLVDTINSEEYGYYNAAWCKAGLLDGEVGPEAIPLFLDGDFLYTIPEHVCYSDLLQSRWEPIPQEEARRLVAAFVASDLAERQEEGPDEELPDFGWLQRTFFGDLFAPDRVAYYTNAPGWERGGTAPAVAALDGQAIALFWLN